MTKINLLPDSFRVKSSSVRTAELLKKIYAILFVIVIIAMSTSIGLFYMYKTRVGEAEERKISLERQIKALEETEQRLILVQDRLSKVQQISEIKDVNEGLGVFEFVLDNSESKIIIGNVTVGEKSIEMQVSSESTLDTFQFISMLKDSQEFSDITVLSMNFSPRQGFATNIALMKK
ncbi:hypothetical protein JXA63_02740 [Candidatus Woesebacteria bacterium]|nr:hypothetical protein [Candidatus Woesebacteria bacterium]